MPLKDLGSPAPNTGSLSVLLHAGACDKPRGCFGETNV